MKKSGRSVKRSDATVIKVASLSSLPSGVSRILGCEEGGQWTEIEANKQDAKYSGYS